MVTAKVPGVVEAEAKMALGSRAGSTPSATRNAIATELNLKAVKPSIGQHAPVACLMSSHYSCPLTSSTARYTLVCRRCCWQTESKRACHNAAPLMAQPMVQPLVATNTHFYEAQPLGQQASKKSFLSSLLETLGG